MVGESLSFGGVADRYDRARPTYPDGAARWLVGDQQARVLELGAGTGKLTGSLVALDHLVLATDPDERMLRRLRATRPDVYAVTARAERIPAANRSVDVVVAAQAFHWFDLPVAVPEMARVLRPHGVLALIWNTRDESVPWVKKLGRLIGTQERKIDPAGALADFEQFGPVQTKVMRHWQSLDRRGFLDLAASRSNLAVMAEEERVDTLAQIGALYDAYERGPGGLRLPYLTLCFRSELQRPSPPPPPRDRSAYVGEATQALDRSGPLVVSQQDRTPPEDPDDATTLIDFR